MEIHNAIPNGYMKIGQLAKKAGITVRTLQYYDKEGLLSPSAESDGGFRLYSDKDLVKLIQILMMKRLGFKLSEIKKRIASMDTTSELLDVLTEHANNIRKEMTLLKESLNAIESLKEEIVQINSIDFKKFADILTHLQIKNERYWLVKYLDNNVLGALKEYASNDEDATSIVDTTNSFIKEASKLHDDSISPESHQGQDLAKRFWDWLMDVTNGDFNIVQKINQQMVKSTSDKKYDDVMEKFRLFMTSSLEIYLDTSSFITEAVKLYDASVSPKSQQGQAFAERFWNRLMELTGGDVNMLQSMNEQFEKNASLDDENLKKSHQFMTISLEFFFNKLTQKE